MLRTPSSGTLTTNHEKTMQTENDTPKPEDSPEQEAGEGCSGATCSRSSRLWEIDHPYYCNEGNYFAKGSEQPHMHFNTWAAFFDEYGDSDMDYNFLIRWDWDEEEERAYTGDDYYRNGILKLFWMGQRKGLYQWSTVEVCRADEPAVREFLQPRWDYMRKMWEPFSCENVKVMAAPPSTPQDDAQR